MFLRERFLDITFETAQDVRPQLVMKTLNGVMMLEIFVHLLKRRTVGESLGHEEVEQRPELLEGVLQRSACDEHAAFSLELHEHAVQQRLGVFEAVGLVDHKVLPAEGAKNALVLHHNLVCRQEDVELELVVLAVELVLLDDLPAGAVPAVHDDVHARGPLAELLRPVGERREGHDDQEGAKDVVVLHKALQEGDGLHCLTKTHLVREYPVCLVAVAVRQPVQAFKLIIAQCSPLQPFGLFFKLHIFEFFWSFL